MRHTRCRHPPRETSIQTKKQTHISSPSFIPQSAEPPFVRSAGAQRADRQTAGGEETPPAKTSPRQQSFPCPCPEHPKTKPMKRQGINRKSALVFLPPLRGHMRRDSLFQGCVRQSRTRLRRQPLHQERRADGTPRHHRDVRCPLRHRRHRPHRRARHP